MDAAATTASSATPFAELITSLAVMQHDQHQALLDLRHDQERRFQAVLQAQQEDRERFRSWIDQEVRPEATVHQAVPAHLPLNKMGPEDDPEAFLDLFEKAAEVHGWPRDQWPMRLVPLLSGESQVAAQQLPVRNLLVFEDLKRAIIQRVGRSPEQHHQRFRSLELGESGRPFVLAQQLRDSCRKWLLADGSDVEEIIDRVVLEQFVTRLPRRTAEWVQCHRPTSLESAIHLAEDHMVACPGVGEPLPSASLSPSFSSPSLSRPVPLPRSRPGGGAGMARTIMQLPESRPGGWTPPLFLRSLHVSHLTHSLPLERRGSLGRPAGVAGTRTILWIGVPLWRWGR
ncbi:hypothetical protein ABG768_015683 [Culter alburnus]|uniref:SCAN box domain-containing protein n=1 Tax=Culter alburnus TaxID=194366 RepID=A0AAW1Z4A4_CULAL